MRWLFVVLLAILIVLQYRLWIAEGSLAEKTRLERQVEEYTRVNAVLRERNAVLEREVMQLKTGKQGVEQRAREQLNLVRDGEVYYQLVDEQQLAADGDTDDTGER